ncbi:sigma-54 dependent transcriptional regulator [Neptunomonas phycophila]|uniref:Sigma-54 dependent transcriptional regulator n=1 Tax=Neptunomonas phycophila TaxID=1572645 RepID=A0ABT9ET31_9GAMM|nr:sigma-54 dependent transcriptional regulator [Neptunomonas phycophila]MDO6468213.1 sigma-54 dependent transcriptional regulator [Neptunomonas phycophila]MDP2522222.1 sigma-54 dependent transcriptional regulator [Neptunomonas phycophila]QLE98861.1 sigma-54-dependent Fis family transcriptional regulator [Neptunomonas phycophila]
MSRILIVEDESIIRAALKRLLEKHSYAVDDAASVDDAVSTFNLNDYQLIISDLRLPGSPGTDLITLAKNTPVLIMTSYASMRSAVDAMKMGAVDYIAKPFNHDEMLATIRTILESAETKTPASLDEPEPDSSAKDTGNLEQGDFVGSCDAMRSLFTRISKVARTDATALILGESGTGKELAAKAIHEQSDRRSAPMISVNCASIPETLIESELFGHEKGSFTGANSARSGLIEAADGGTLFLDEIGELPLEAQARLLRFLQESEIRRVGSVQSKKVNVRLVAATHRNLKELAKQGLFREDLYYRLYVMELRMPPLRERGQDILELADQFLIKACEKMSAPPAMLSPSCREIMLGYHWPGNVRELENAIERAVILADDHIITPELLGLDVEVRPSLETIEHTYGERTANNPPTDLPVQKQSRAGLSLDDYFQRFVLENQERMNETDLAKKLGVSRKCLWERRQKLGIPRKPKVAQG